eukprot:249254-Prymnesium_polylepis.1
MCRRRSAVAVTRPQASLAASRIRRVLQRARRTGPRHRRPSTRHTGGTRGATSCAFAAAAAGERQ